MTQAFGPLSITVAGEQQVRLGITRITRQVDDLRSLWVKWQLAFFAAEIDLFAASPWVPLSPAYAEWKATHYPGGGTLRASGALMRSLVSKGKGHVFKATKRAMEIGTEVASARGAPYPLYHQLGAGNNPVRKPIDLEHMDAGSSAGHFGRALVEWGDEMRKGWAT